MFYVQCFEPHTCIVILKEDFSTSEMHKFIIIIINVI